MVADEGPDAPALPTAREQRSRRGALAWQSGAMAEDSVARAYEARGCAIAKRRWRSPWGEVDLIARDGASVVVVEVKKARSLDQAAHRLSRRQMDRLCAAAGAFCEGEARGALTELRFDLALVDGMGRVRLVENAWGEDW